MEQNWRVSGDQGEGRRPVLMQESHAKAQAKQSQGSWFSWGTTFIVNHIDVFSLFLFITTWVRIGVKVYFFLLGSRDPVEGFLCARHTNLKLAILPTCSLWYLPKCMYHQGQLSMCLALPQSWPMTICVNTEYTHRMLTKNSMARHRGTYRLHASYPRSGSRHGIVRDAATSSGCCAPCEALCISPLLTQVLLLCFRSPASQPCHPLAEGTGHFCV